MANQTDEQGFCAELSLPQKARLNRLLEEWLSLPTAQRRHFLANQSSQEPDIFREFKALTSLELDNPSGDSKCLPELAHGRVLGAWQLQKPLGEGGMGQVWLAERADGAFQMKVALKIIHETLPRPDLIAQFTRERQILADLQHPHICRLIDGGTTADGTPYLVMEYIEGVTLSQWLRAGPHSDQAVLAIIRQACAACAHAHQHDVLHCDLKPDNMMVNSEGTLKLLDFGIAELHSQTRPKRIHWEPLTPEYAPPERLQGQRPTPAGDVYSLGLVWLTLLTGAHPRDQSLDPRSRLAHWQHHQQDKIFSKRVVALLARMIAEQPDARPTCDAQLIQAMDELIQFKLASKPGSNHLTRPRLSFIALLITVLGLIGIGSLWFDGRFPPTTGILTSAAAGGQESDPVLFSDRADTLKILVLPFIKLEDCKASDASIEQALVDAFRALSIETQLPMDIAHLDVQGSPAYAKAKAIGTRFGADLVIWGNFYEQCHSAHEIVIKHVNLALAGLHKSHHKNIKLIDIQDSSFQHEIHQLIINSLGHKRYLQKDYRQAILYWQQLTAQDQIPSILHRGTAWRKIGDESKAQELFRQALQQPINFFQHGIAHQGLADYEQAISYYSLALQKTPNHLSALANRGNCYLALKQYDLAIEDLSSAIQLDPNYSIALNYRGCAYMDTKQYQKALADFQSVIDLGGRKRAVAYSNQGLIYLEQGKVEQALGKFSQAIRENPRFANAYGYRGTVHLRNQRTQFAEQDFQSAIRIEPRQAKSRWIMAKAHARWGDPQIAENALVQAFERDMKHYVTFAHGEPALDRLRNRPSFIKLMDDWSRRWDEAYGTP